MKPAALLIISLLAGAGCALKYADSPPLGIAGPITQFGDYTNAEVERVRAAVERVPFPVPEGTIVRQLLRPLKSEPIEFADYWPDREKKGRMGGNIVEYWLNREFVLRVASAYYAQGDKHFTMEEWAVVLRREERDDYRRAIYPGAVIPVEPKR